MCRLAPSLVCLAALVALPSCSGAGSVADPPTATSNEPPVDPEATIEAYADTLRVEADVLRIELETGDVDDEAVGAFWSALQERITHADELQAMLEADPTRVEPICGWYEARLRGPYLEVVRLRNRISERDGNAGAPNGWAQLLKRGAGSAEGARAYLTTMREHPADLTNLHIMCIKFGHIGDE